MNTQWWAVGIVIFCALLGAIGQLLFKLGSISVSFNLMSWVTNTKIIGGMCLYGISAVLFIIALKYGNLSVLYPLIATSMGSNFLCQILRRTIFSH